jgi:alkanesulfonate monooxygenase SsuD/methylene tetrahydromethanopterin reductase-like flavin-dependent oxidoreductase (luciferase family)
MTIPAFHGKWGIIDAGRNRTMENAMPQPLPAISLVAMPGRRRQTLDIAREVERRGFSGIYVPSRFGNMAQCVGLALATERILFGTAIAPIYARTVEEFAHAAAYLHEISGGRFRFGIGIAHGPTYQRLGVTPGKPLADIRGFVEKVRSYEGIGPLPPIILAALRKRMVALAAEISEGVIFANASLSHMSQSLAVVPAAKRENPNFLIGNMLPVCVSEDVGAAKALLRRRLVHYAMLPNYRAYWKEAGYLEEMTAVEKAIADNRPADIPNYLTDRWLADNTLFGPATKVRDGIEAWRAAGVTTPILVPNSAVGNQITALKELLATFTR